MKLLGVTILFSRLTCSTVPVRNKPVNNGLRVRGVSRLISAIFNQNEFYIFLEEFSSHSGMMLQEDEQLQLSENCCSSTSAFVTPSETGCLMKVK